MSAERRAVLLLAQLSAGMALAGLRERVGQAARSRLSAGCAQKRRRSCCRSLMNFVAMLDRRLTAVPAISFTCARSCCACREWEGGGQQGAAGERD